MMNIDKIQAKEKYRAIATSDWPVFFQPWWLDVATSENWDVAMVMSQKNEIVACMPYSYGRNVRRIMMPPLTPFLGRLILKNDKTKYSEVLSYEMNLVAELMGQLGTFSYYEQKWPRDFTNWLPLNWKGFNQVTKYTYVINDLSDLAAVKLNFRKNLKDDINKALKSVKVQPSSDIKMFYDVYVKTFKRQGLTAPIPFELMSNIITESIKRDQGGLFIAKDELGHVHSVLFVVWDNNTTYYIASGADPEFRNSGATSLLYWEVMQFASAKLTAVDFSGSIVKPIEKFLRSFGATQVPYFEISKINSRLLRIKEGFQKIKTAMIN